MPYRVSFDEEGRIVHVTFSASAVKDDHYAAFDAALVLCQKHACSRLLVDFSGLCTSSLSTADSFLFGKAVAKAPISLRIAHVMPKHAKASENVSFASIVEANRGKRTGEFETIEQARNWLLSMPSVPITVRRSPLE
jgi:hypothetical protein